MKQLVGSDRGAFAFDPVAGTIAFSGLPDLTLANVLVVTNVTAGVMLYNFADPAMGGSLTGNVLSLEGATTGMAATDTLQVWVDVPAETPVDLRVVLRKVLTALVYPPWLDRVQNRRMARVTVESGTVSTVGTVTNVSSIDSYQGRVLAIAASATGWATCVRARWT